MGKIFHFLSLSEKQAHKRVSPGFQREQNSSCVVVPVEVLQFRRARVMARRSWSLPSIIA